MVIMGPPGDSNLYEAMHADRERERIARTMTTCPTCGRPKESGPVVCWGDCWRGPDGLKNSALPAGVWLNQQPWLSLDDDACLRCGVRSAIHPITCGNV